MKHSFEERLLAVQKCLEGQAPYAVGQELKIDEHAVKAWLERYKLKGEAGLRKATKKRVSFAKKCKIVCEYAEKGVSLPLIYAKYNVSCSIVQKWAHAYRKGGYEALRNKLRKPSRIIMGRPKKQQPQTELERLRYENEYLRAEVALLKKVKALMEEKEKRLHEIGRKPSKH
jgi:transposase-like protein